MSFEYSISLFSHLSQKKSDKLRPTWDGVRPTWDEVRPTWDEARPTWDGVRPTWDEVRPTWDDFRPTCFAFCASTPFDYAQETAQQQQMLKRVRQ